MFFDNVSTDMFFGKRDIAWNYMSHHNTVSVATRLWATQSGSLNPSMVKRFFSCPNIQARSGAHPASYSTDTGVLSQG